MLLRILYTNQKKDVNKRARPLSNRQDSAFFFQATSRHKIYKPKQTAQE